MKCYDIDVSRSSYTLNKFSLIMKLTIILVITAILQTSAASFAQKITISEKNVTLEKILKKIRKQTGYDFFYNTKMIKQARPVTINIHNVDIHDALEASFKNQPFAYYIDNKTIMVKAINNASPVLVTRTKITGTVTDDKGLGLPGATVTVKGTNKAVITNNDGKFIIDVEPNEVLVFSFTGFTTKEVAYAGGTTINVQLTENTALLESVVVVGYGTQKKVNLTGAVSTVAAKQLEDRPVTNVSNALQGTMSGVTVTTSNGQPGKDGGTINIRGIGTLGSTSPMIIVDGIVSSMDNINPNDIDNISVLKDAASASIYGSRASNGVVLITTKRGKAGVSSITYNVYLGQQKATNLPSYLSSAESATMLNQALRNEGKTLRYTDAEIEKFRNGSDPYNYPNTDWLDLFYQGSGFQQNHYLAFSGGTEKTQYAISLGYFDQTGLVKNTTADKYTSRININSQVSEKISVNGNVGFTQSVTNEPVNPYTGDFSQIIRQINRISPMVPYKYANGNYGYISDGSPMAWLEGGSFNKQKYYNLLANVGADWNIIDGLRFKPTLGYRLNINQNKKFIKDQQYYDRVTGLPSFYQGPNSLTDHNDFLNAVTVQGLLQYDKTFGKHTLGALAGYSQESTTYNELEGYRKNFLNNSLSELNAGPVDGQTNSGYAYQIGLQSFFGRLNYNYDGKYLFEANLRYDATSHFSPDNRWGAFPSLSAGWRISQEQFFQSLKSWVNELKLRGSWGKLGNQAIRDNHSHYPYISTISTGQDYVFGGTSPVIAPGIAVVNGANQNIKWETATTTGIGLDAAFLNNRFTLSADYFVKNTDDILLAIPVAETVGVAPPVQNAGSVQNKGWEFTLGFHDKKGDFDYSINLNATFIKNKITDLHETGPIISGGTFRQVGYPIDGFYGYLADGIFQTQAEVTAHAKQSGGTIGPGDLKYRDINNDGVIDGSDRTYLGSNFPKATFGLNLSGSWKGIDLTIFLQGAANVKNYVQGIMLGQVGSTAGKPTSAMLDAWTPQNTGASFPRLWSGFTQNDPSRVTSSFWVRDADYLRLKNPQVGYTLPTKYTSKIGLVRARIYYSGQNLFTATSFYKWVDPEAPRGDSGYAYPQVMVNSIGLNVTF